MNRHEADAVSIGFGTVYLVFVGWWLVLRLIDVSLPSFGWVAGAALVAAGLAGVYAVLRKERGSIKTATASADPTQPS
jgi:hypothetical protein